MTEQFGEVLRSPIAFPVSIKPWEQFAFQCTNCMSMSHCHWHHYGAEFLEKQSYWHHSRVMLLLLIMTDKKKTCSLTEIESFQAVFVLLFTVLHLHLTGELQLQKFSPHQAVRTTRHILQSVTNPPQNLQGPFGLIWLDLHSRYIMQLVRRGNSSVWTAGPPSKLKSRD